MLIIIVVAIEKKEPPKAKPDLWQFYHENQGWINCGELAAPMLKAFGKKIRSLSVVSEH